MFSFILKPSIQALIDEHIGKPIVDLALQKKSFSLQDWRIILNQIEAKTKAKNKLPTWFETQNIVYPSKVSIEQTSSEPTARYKSQIVSETVGFDVQDLEKKSSAETSFMEYSSLIDLTGGFGVDTFYFAQKMTQVVHCETDKMLSEIVGHNLKVLKVTNVDCMSGDSALILKTLNKKWNWIYIDPSRRHDAKGKVFMLKDCEPYVPGLLPVYFTYADRILIKTAPILDITSGLNELAGVRNIHIVALNNEVKELLWEINKEYMGPIILKTVHFIKGGVQLFETVFKGDYQAAYGTPKRFLYEPNCAIMKSGAFTAVSALYHIDKLHQNTHLYTSDSLIIDFPGRCFQIEQVISYKKEDMRINLQGRQAHITLRNFPDTVANMRKKWKIKEGGVCYCFFTTGLDEKKVVLICSKIEKTFL